MTSERNRDGLVGQVLDDRYEIVRRLARGGMSTVYVAHDLRLSRTVAIKMMNQGLGDAEDFAARFDAEARAAAHLSHQNVVSVFDQGTDQDRPYIVMEYVSGGTLRQLITREAPMEPLRMLTLIEPVTAALAAAHAAGIIHRDIKPENVLISDSGLVKVADFGLARAVTSSSQAGTSGLVLGTVSYIAPELVTRGAADARSDVYSLGIVMYEMLTGRKPHTGDEPIQVAYSHVHHQIPAPSMELSTSWREGGIPPYIDALVTTAANKDRANRPLHAGVVLDHIRAARIACLQGVIDDPALTSRMHETSSVGSPDEESTTAIPAPEDGALSSPTATLSVVTDDDPSPSTIALKSAPVSPHTRALPTITTDKPRRRPRQGRWRRIIATAAAIAVLGSGGWGVWYVLEGRWTTTPGLVELTQSEAQGTAQEIGVGVVFEREYSETVPLGQVIRTDPVEGERVLADGVITAWVSLGPERYAVPELVGLTRAEAETQISDQNLTVGEVTEVYHDTAPAGQILAQGTPAEEEVKRDTGIDLTISQGPAPVETVDFTGKPFQELTTWAEENLITIESTEENHASIPAGAVIQQEPTSGTLHRGGSVHVVVSKGPVMVTIPTGLRGMGASNVASQLQGLGFRTQYERVVTGGFGIVLRLDPAEGATVPSGSLITIYTV